MRVTHELDGVPEIHLTVTPDDDGEDFFVELAFDHGGEGFQIDGPASVLLRALESAIAHIEAAGETLVEDGDVSATWNDRSADDVCADCATKEAN